MEKLSSLARFQQHQNIVLEGFDPVSAGGFTQVPNFILNNQQISPNAKVIYAKLLSYAWHNNSVFPGQDKMAVEIGSSQQSVSRGIRELEDAGFLLITRRGQGMTNIYTLHHTVKQKRRK
ncbi:MAG: helix-turn-helix domain-containing protein [Anaerolineae bacterium]|nr:helix-turn-helix domain-containing protein [Anaerolineae bacterium]